MNLLKFFWGKWRKLARKAGNFQGLVIFTAFYFVLLWTVGIFIAFFTDPLNIKSNKKLKSNFSAWIHPEEDLTQAQKPY